MKLLSKEKASEYVCVCVFVKLLFEKNEIMH